MVIPLPWLGVAWGGHFLAGLCDAVAGGGGMIGLPALLATGLPPHVALGTNKLSSTVGTLVSTWRLARAVPVNPRVLWVGIPLAMGGAWVGSHLVLSLSPDKVTWLLMGVLPLALGMMWLAMRHPEGHGSSHPTPPTTRPLTTQHATISTVAGLYDGAIGPGVGTFLLVGLNRWGGLSLLQASLHTKCINLSTNVMALCVMLSAGKILWGIGIGCAMANACGAWVGTQVTLRWGDTIIRRVLPWVMGGIVITLGIRMVG